MKGDAVTSRGPAATHPDPSLRDDSLRKLLAAVLTLASAGAILLLPPVANKQLAAAVDVLQEPVVAVVVAAVVLAASAWRFRFAAGLAAILAVIAAVHIAYYFITTAPGRTASDRAAAWTDVPLAAGAQGVAENTPNVFGAARLEWSGRSVRLSLRSETGTTQQGYYLDGGPVLSRFLFSARIEKISGGDAVTCPLLFGIADNRNYFTFRLQDTPDGGLKAIAYQIVPNSAEFTSGFHGVLIDETAALPYVNHWNVMDPSERTETTLGVEADGDYYRFYVNSREVFARRVDRVPTHTVAPGVTVLANDLKSEAVCEFADVRLRVAD